MDEDIENRLIIIKNILLELDSLLEKEPLLVEMFNALFISFKIIYTEFEKNKTLSDDSYYMLREVEFNLENIKVILDTRQSNR